MKTVNRVPAILRDLQTGFGAQRMPPSLVAIEVFNVPTNQTRIPLRLFLKTILPRVKYNNPALRIDVQKVKVLRGEEKTVEKEESAGGAPRVYSEPNPSARLIFDILPTQVVKMGRRRTANDIARSVFQRIADVTGEALQTVPTEEDNKDKVYATAGASKKLNAVRKKGIRKAEKEQATAAAVGDAAKVSDDVSSSEAEGAKPPEEQEYVYTPYIKPTVPVADGEEEAGKRTRQL